MKKSKYIIAILATTATTWVNGQINTGPNNSINGNAAYSSIAAGDHNRITSTASDAIIGGGWANTNAAHRGAIGGGAANWATTDFSTIPGGARAKTRSHGQLAYASGGFGGGAIGEAQFGLYVLRGTTVGAVTEPLALNGDSNTEHIVVPANGSYLFDIDIVARAVNKVNGYYGNFFHYKMAVENQNGDLLCTQLDGIALTAHN